MKIRYGDINDTAGCNAKEIRETMPTPKRIG